MTTTSQKIVWLQALMPGGALSRGKMKYICSTRSPDGSHTKAFIQAAKGTGMPLGIAPTGIRCGVDGLRCVCLAPKQKALRNGQNG